VLIAVNDNLNSSIVIVPNNDDTELLFVRVKGCVFGCYYRPPNHKNLSTVPSSLHTIAEKFPQDRIILVGDMNIPGIDWHQMLPKPHTQDQSLQIEFLDILAEHDMYQLVTQPTHIHGNTLDPVCTTSPHSLHHEVIFPGLSDHALILVHISIKGSSEHTNSIKTVEQYHKADVVRFCSVLSLVADELVQ